MVTNNSDNYSPTQYNVQTGGASGTLNNVAPTSTSGIPVISQGSSAQPIFGTAVVAGGGTGLTSATAYAVICGGTTSTAALQSVASAGTTGQLLGSNGAGALPTFQGAASLGSSYVLIQSQTVSAVASVAFTSGLTTYNNLFLTFTNVTAATTATTLQMQLSTNGGSSYLSSGYQAGFIKWVYNTTTFTNVNSTTLIPLAGTVTNVSTDPISAYLYIMDVTSGASIKVTGDCVRLLSGSPSQTTVMANNTNTGVNAFKIFFSSGNITTGTFNLYGILES